MAFEGLSEKLGGVFKKLKSRGKLTEAVFTSASVSFPKQT